MTDFEKFVELGGHEDNADTLATQIPHDLEDLLFGLNVDSSARLVKKDDAGTGV